MASAASRCSTGARRVARPAALLRRQGARPAQTVRGSSDIDQRADVWGFCVVLYEALSGRAPFQRESPEAILHSVLVDEPKPLGLDASVDAALAALVQAGLAKDRDERPASSLELGR